MKKYAVLFFAAWLLSAFSPSRLYSQLMGAFKGTIKEKGSGVLLADVRVTIISIRNSQNRFELFTDDKGYFYKTGLSPEAYQISFEKNGYVPAMTTARLTIGETVDASVELEAAKQQAGLSAAEVTQGMKLLTDAKYVEAGDAFTRLLAKDAVNPVLLYYRGFCFEKLKEFDKALADYQKAVEFKPDFVLALAGIGNVYAKKNQFGKAVDIYKKAFDLNLSDLTSLYNYGSSLVNVGQSAQAKVVFEKIVSLDERYADAYYELGILYLGEANNAKAKEMLQKFLELDPANRNAAIAQEILKTLK